MSYKLIRLPTYLLLDPRMDLPVTDVCQAVSHPGLEQENCGHSRSVQKNLRIKATKNGNHLLAMQCLSSMPTIKKHRPIRDILYLESVYFLFLNWNISVQVK